MGGKRASGRTSAGGGQSHPRISSAGSTKESTNESIATTSAAGTSSILKPQDTYASSLEDDSVMDNSQRKDGFDIISLLGTGSEETTPTEERVNGSHSESKNQQRKSRESSDVPSFWHFVQPETSAQQHQQNEIFHHRAHHPYHPLKNKREGAHGHHNVKHKNNVIKNSTSNTRVPPLPQLTGGNKPSQNVPLSKRAPRKRKVKKVVQSAKVAGLKALERSPERLQREGVEWIRVLTPPGTDSVCDADDDDDGDEEEEEEDEDDDEDDSRDEDELIKRYLSGLSSAGSSISWAEDAMESEFTSQLKKLWEDIESVCGGESRPDTMSDAVYDECLQWRRAFPNPDLHRFVKNEIDISPVTSPSLYEDLSLHGADGDAPYSSLVHSPRYFNKAGGTNRRGYDDSMNLLQSNFRTLNCATPRPNIEKSTQYVSAWLSECQNTYVPGADGNLHRHSALSSSPQEYTNGYSVSQSMGSSSNHHKFGDNGPGSSRHTSLRMVSDIARSSYAHFSRSHAKFVAEPDPENFFTSLATTTNNDTSPSYHFSKIDSFRGGSMTSDRHNAITTTTNSGGAGTTYVLSNGYRSRINESDEEYDDEDDHANLRSPTELVSFRSSNVRVQRPISSRIRDHTMTPIATGTYGSRLHQHGILNLNRQVGPTAAITSASASRSPTGSPTTTLVDVARTMRISSGLVRHSFGHHQYGRSGRQQQHQQQQAPWSRHSGEDLVAETSYVSSLYENYQSVTENSGAGNGRTEGLRNRRSPGSPKDTFMHFNDRSVLDGPNSIPEDQPFKPAIPPWLLNRRVSPN